MSKRLIASMLFLLLAACSAALIVLPARWLIMALPAAWPVAIVDASGTVWSGAATIAIGAPGRRRTIADPLNWKVSLQGGPALTLTHSWLRNPLALKPSWSGVAISAQTLLIPVTVLGTLDARLAAIDPGGELSLSWPAMRLGRDDRPPGTLLLNAEWRSATSALTPVRPLGDYAFTLKQGSQDAIDLNLSSRQGPLILNGTGTAGRGGELRFNGTAQVDPAAGQEIHAALGELLAAIGPRRDNAATFRFP
ncbi:MAG: type II secretion system protein N [Candidimonas sp.]